MSDENETPPSESSPPGDSRESSGASHADLQAQLEAQAQDALIETELPDDLLFNLLPAAEEPDGTELAPEPTALIEEEPEQAEVVGGGLELIGGLEPMEASASDNAESAGGIETPGGIEAPGGITPIAEGSGETGDGTDAAGEDGDEEDGGRRRRRRKRKDPLENIPKVYSQDAAMSQKQLTSLSQLKTIKKARVRHEGKRVVTDDVKKLKSLRVEPKLNVGDFINYYVEPVRIEYYIPKESRFAVETKFLYIPLVDPEPREKDHILRESMEENIFVDLIDVMNAYPRHITEILEAYNNSMSMYESLSAAIYDADGGDPERYRTAFYICEVLAEYEPTLAGLKFLGDFQAWNLNWLVRRMNTLGVEFHASDKTVSYFIKLRNEYWEKNNFDYDEDFEILAALFFEQAYPNRGMTYDMDDYIYGAFDDRIQRKKKNKDF